MRRILTLLLLAGAVMLAPLIRLAPLVRAGSAAPYSLWLPAVMRSSPLLPPTPGVTSTPMNGLTVRGRVSLVEPGGAGLQGVAIRLFFSSYYPGDEMVMVWPELAGSAFEPPHHYWRHYAGLEYAARDFIAHAVAPTEGATLTASPSATHAPTATQSTTSTATATATASPAPTGTSTPTWTATPTPTHTPASSGL
jgi:hypothetical protein